MKITRNDLQDRLDGMLDKANMQGAAARIYPLYQKLQTERFMSENASEGSSWNSLTSKYAEAKLKSFRSYPGGGRKLLIATSSLAGAVIGPGSPFKGTENHIAVFTRYSMRILVNVSGENAAGKRFDYPQYVAENRPFMKFSQTSLDLMKSELSKFILGG